MRTTVNPTDQTASALQQDVAGTVTDDAISSPATGTQNKVSITVNATNAVSLAAGVGVRTGTASTWYSTNGGGAWTEIVAARATASGAGGSQTTGPANYTVNLGNGINVANIQVRAQAVLSGVGVQAGDTVQSDINSWNVQYGDYVILTVSDIL